MNTYKIKWTAFALQSLEHIYDYILTETTSVNIASNYINKLIERTDQLSTHPFSGQKEPFLISTGQNSRYILEGNYKIIYQLENKKIIITDVFHVKQNPVKIRKNSDTNKRKGNKK